MKKPTGPQLKALQLIADNPGRVICQFTPPKGDGWLKVHGNVENSLTDMTVSGFGIAPIRRSAQPVVTITRTIYGQPCVLAMHAWELTDAGRALLAEHQGEQAPQQETKGVVAAADAVAAGVADAIDALSSAGRTDQAPASQLDVEQRRGPSPQVAADVDAAREALAEKFTCIDTAPTRNSGFTAAWAPDFPGAVRIGRTQGMRTQRPSGPYSQATQLWDGAMVEYAAHLERSGFRVSRVDDRGVVAYRKRPAAPVPGEGVDVSDVPPQRALAPTSAGRARKDRNHPNYTARYADAMAGLELLGVKAGELTDLRIRDNAVFRDERSGAVVKVGRPGTGARALLELRVSWWLQTAGWDEAAYVRAYGTDPREMPGFAAAWKLRTLVSVLFAGRSASVSSTAREQADHRIATLLNDRARPWRWSSI